MIYRQKLICVQFLVGTLIYNKAAYELFTSNQIACLFNIESFNAPILHQFYTYHIEFNSTRIFLINLN